MLHSFLWQKNFSLKVYFVKEMSIVKLIFLFLLQWNLKRREREKIKYTNIVLLKVWMNKLILYKFEFFTRENLAFVFFLYGFSYFSYIFNTNLIFKYKKKKKDLPLLRCRTNLILKWIYEIFLIVFCDTHFNKQTHTQVQCKFIFNICFSI